MPVTNLESSSIKLRRHTSSAATAPTTLSEGEFAINLVDGHLYYGGIGGNSVSSSFNFDSIKTFSASIMSGAVNDPLGTALVLIAPDSGVLNPDFNPALIATGTLQVHANANRTSNFNHILQARDLVVTNTASISYLHTTYESASIIYSSGSTKFGDSMDDTHIRTGSMYITGNLDVSGAISASSYYGIEQSKFTTASSVDTDLLRLKIFNFDNNVFVSVDSSSGQLTLQFGESNLPELLLLSSSTGLDNAFVDNRFSEASCSYKIRSNWDTVSGVTYISHSLTDGYGNVLHTTGSVLTPLQPPDFSFTELNFFIKNDGNSYAGSDGGEDIGDLKYLTSGSQAFTASLYIIDGAGISQTITQAVYWELDKDNPTNNILFTSSLTINNSPVDYALGTGSTNNTLYIEKGLEGSITITTNSIADSNSTSAYWVLSDYATSESFQTNAGAEQNKDLFDGTLYILTSSDPGGGFSFEPYVYFATSSTIATATATRNQQKVVLSATGSYTSLGAPGYFWAGNDVSTGGGEPNATTIKRTKNIEFITSIRTYCTETSSYGNETLTSSIYNINNWTSSIYSGSLHFNTTSIDGFTYTQPIPNEASQPAGLYIWVIYDADEPVVSSITQNGENVTELWTQGTLGNPNQYRYLRTINKQTEDAGSTYVFTV